MTTLLGYRSLVQEAAALRSGADAPLDAVRRTCDRIDAVDPGSGPSCRNPGAATGCRPRPGVGLGRSTGPRRAPALYGVPVGIKDIVHVDGLPTRAGSALPADELTGPRRPSWTGCGSPGR
ncbi:amidase family protein [Streptomyces albulus]|nr:amidase family protein [Streptomyces noursei]